MQSITLSLDTSLNTTVMFGSQLSDAVKVTAGFGIAPQLTVSSEGAPDNIGAVVSSTNIC